MYLYCVELQQKLGNTYLYTEKENINELAKYVNGQVNGHSESGIHVKVKGAYIIDDYNSPLNDRVFLPTEYKEQYFLETYEDRLREGYRIQRLAF